MKPITAGFDCETTGVSLFHGDLPFMACFTFNQPMPELNGHNQITWEWPVDPKTRIPIYDPDDLVEIVQWLSRTDITWFLHNAKFDVRCIEMAIRSWADRPALAEPGLIKLSIPDFDPEEFLNRCHDTHLMSHAIDNRGSHGLKDLGIRYLNIGEDDREFLQQQVESLIPFANSLNWKIACPQNCPHVAKKPDDGWWVMDMWIPQAVEKCINDTMIPCPVVSGAFLHTDVTVRYLHSIHPSLYVIDPATKRVSIQNLCNVYCLRDTDRTILLGEFLLHQLENTYVEREIPSRSTDPFQAQTFNVFQVNLMPAYELNRQQLPVAYHMESHGLPVLKDKLDSERIRLRDLAAKFEHGAKSILEVIELNLNAPAQVASILSYKFGIEIERETATGDLTIDKDEAEGFYRQTQEYLEFVYHNPSHYDEAIVQKAVKLRDFLYCYMGFKKCNKAASTDLASYTRKLQSKPYWGQYATWSVNPEVEDALLTAIKPMPLDSYFDNLLVYILHTLYNIVGTDTVRYSSQDPNSQNIGKGKGILVEAIKALGLSLRGVFGPPPGRKFYAIDGKQLQVVIAAYTSGVPALRAAVERGDDLHEFTHKELCNILRTPFDPNDELTRGLAKNCNFGYLFGAGEEKTDTTAHMPGLYPMLVQLFPEARDRIKQDIKYVREHGYIMAGPYKLAPPPDKPYSATVYKVQGLEGVIIKTAMRTIWEGTRDTDYHLFLNVHDEILLDVPEKDNPGFLPWCVKAIEDAGLQYGIPCKADVKVITTNWSEGRKVSL